MSEEHSDDKGLRLQRYTFEKVGDGYKFTTTTDGLWVMAQDVERLESELAEANASFDILNVDFQNADMWNKRYADEIEALRAKYAAECDASMMAGQENSALRLQLRDAEQRASEYAKRWAACGKPSARDSIIEECAKVCDREYQKLAWDAPHGGDAAAASTCAAEIRSLKSAASDRTFLQNTPEEPKRG